jgi:hypothetical protein
MKNFISLFALMTTIALIADTIALRLTNPQLTETQIFIEQCPEILFQICILFICHVIYKIETE